MKMILFGVALSILVMTSLPILATDELPFVTGEWPPYSSEQIDGYGVCTEIVSAIVQEMGMIPKYNFFPWRRAELMVQQGEAFGAFPYAPNPERQENFDFSEMLLQHKMVFFYNQQAMSQPPTWTTLADLRAYRIGGVMGNNYESAFTNAGLTVHYVNSEKLNVNLLYANRVDLILTDEAVGRYLIQQLYPAERDIFGVLAKSFKTGNSHLMISRAYPFAERLRVQFNEAFQRIKANGTYRAILTKYGITTP